MVRLDEDLPQHERQQDGLDLADVGVYPLTALLEQILRHARLEDRDRDVELRCDAALGAQRVGALGERLAKCIVNWQRHREEHDDRYQQCAANVAYSSNGEPSSVVHTRFMLSVSTQLNIELDCSYLL